MKKFYYVLLSLLLVFLTACSNSNGKLEKQKEKKVIEVAIKMANAEYEYLTNMREAAIVASADNCYTVCIAYDCTDNPHTSPTEVFVTFRVNSFIYDADRKLLANVTYSDNPFLVTGEGYNLLGYYYPCAQYGIIESAARSAGWLNISESAVNIDGVEAITGGKEKFEGGGSKNIE